MNVLGIVGSMRKQMYTHTLVNQIISDMQAINPSVVADIIHIADKDIRPCRVVCFNYCSTHPYQCSISDDVPTILQQMVEADAVILGTPLYFRAPPAKFHTLIERLISLFFVQDPQGGNAALSPLRGKPCGLVGVAEYSNPHQILEYLHDFCTVLKMHPVRLERFPYLGVAGQGDIEKDEVFYPFERSLDLAEALLNST